MKFSTKLCASGAALATTVALGIIPATAASAAPSAAPVAVPSAATPRTTVSGAINETIAGVGTFVVLRGYSLIPDGLNGDDLAIAAPLESVDAPGDMSQGSRARALSQSLSAACANAVSTHCKASACAATASTFRRSGSTTCG